jgi:hypothetical protein
MNRHKETRPGLRWQGCGCNPSAAAPGLACLATAFAWWLLVGPRPFPHGFGAQVHQVGGLFFVFSLFCLGQIMR